MLVTVLFAAVMVVVAAALAALLTAAPFVVAVDMAERRRLSPGRWGAVQLALTGLGGVLAYLTLRHSALLLVPVPFLCWLAPVGLALMGDSPGRLGGYQGAHEA
jgi:hypothetical protein